MASGPRPRLDPPVGHRGASAAVRRRPRLRSTQPVGWPSPPPVDDAEPTLGGAPRWPYRLIPQDFRTLPHSPRPVRSPDTARGLVTRTAAVKTKRSSKPSPSHPRPRPAPGGTRRDGPHRAAPSPSPPSVALTPRMAMPASPRAWSRARGPRGPRLDRAAPRRPPPRLRRADIAVVWLHPLLDAPGGSGDTAGDRRRFLRRSCGRWTPAHGARCVWPGRRALRSAPRHVEDADRSCRLASDRARCGGVVSGPSPPP
jgi:hypothetical protein